MRSYTLFLFVLTYVLGFQSANAEIKVRGMSADTANRDKSTVTCLSCTTHNHFALTGAAAAKALGHTKIRIRSGDGRTIYHVTLSTAYENASATIGGGVGVTASITHGVVDPESTTVAGYPIWGVASGSNWVPHGVPNSTIEARCNVLIEYEQKAQERMDYAEALWERYGAAVENNHGTGRGWRGIPWARASGSRIIPPDDCSNCRAEEIEVHRE